MGPGCPECERRIHSEEENPQMAEKTAIGNGERPGPGLSYGDKYGDCRFSRSIPPAGSPAVCALGNDKVQDCGGPGGLTCETGTSDIQQEYDRNILRKAVSRSASPGRERDVDRRVA